MSDQITKAFGNNLKQDDSSPVRFADFSGDVNQDGSVDLTDTINTFIIVPKLCFRIHCDGY